MNGYALYHNIDKIEITIKPFSVSSQYKMRLSEYEEGVYIWNKNMYISEDRKKLIQVARTIKKDWVEIYYSKTQRAGLLKIKHRY